MYLVTLRQFSFAVACYWVFRVAKPRYVIENCPSKFYIFSSDKRPPLKLSGVLQTIVVYQVCPAKTNGSPSRAFCHFRPSERFLPTTLHRRSTKSQHTRPDRSLYKQSSAIQQDTRCLHQHKHSRPASTVNIHLNKQRNVHNKTPNNGSLPFLFHPAIQITPASSLSRKKKCFDNAVVVRF